MLYGGIEAGGTKIVCALGSSPADVRAETRIPTRRRHDSARAASPRARRSAGSTRC